MELDIHKQLASKLLEWIEDPENYSMVHFAVENKISKEKLLQMSTECVELGEAVEYGFSVQEYKITEGALSGQLDRQTALKMLETYSGWRGEMNIIQKNEYVSQRDSAIQRAEEIISGE
jgi:uncharacterized protein YpiB (UPF0302 family)